MSRLYFILGIFSLFWCPLPSLLIENNRELNQIIPIRKGKLNLGTSQWNTLNGKPTLLFGHRGERTLLPANTLPSYEIAAIEGADYVEPDLYLTKDDVLVCFHDLFLKGETDVESHPEFAYLRRNYTSVPTEELGFATSTNDWIIKDFTLQQLRTLRIKQTNIGIRPQYFNFLFGIPTFQEYLDVIHKMTAKLNRTIGIIPELKYPAFNNQNKSSYFMEDKFLEIIKSNGYAVGQLGTENCLARVNASVSKEIICPPVIVQSFHQETLRYLRSRLNYELMLLLGVQPSDYTYIGLLQASTFANYISVWKGIFLTTISAAFPNAIEPSNFATVAHTAGLKLAVFTISDSRESSETNCTAQLPICKAGKVSKKDEMNYFFKLGVDGLFVENIPESMIILLKYQKK